MQTIWADLVLTSDGWRSGVTLEIDRGRILRMKSDTSPAGYRAGLLLPAPANGHSHAFQRAMAGLSEHRGPNKDSFWTWRSLMYRFLEHLTPEQVCNVAAYAQMEMLEAGFGASVEFHYLHHQQDGTPYTNLGEMSAQICVAAGESGIGLTLLPVHYQYGGCDRRPLSQGQRRFGNTPDRFSRLVEDARGALTCLPDDARIGVAPHSLRAVATDDLTDIVALADGGPVHMHLAEQLAEVEEVHAALGARPVSWALNNLALGASWSLIHCTQMTARETTDLAATGATVGLCPLTEANLGDGVFDGVRYLDAGGRFAIGSDSNIRISLSEELRQFETSQRLRDNSRAALATEVHTTGRRLLEDAAAGGAQAAGRGSGRIEEGAYADLLALDAGHPDLAGLPGDAAIDTFVFAGGPEMVQDVWSAGRHLVQGGRHIRRNAITRAYKAAVLPLRADL